MADVYAGVDIETTGTDVGLHVVCQLGIALSDGSRFTSIIGHEDFKEDEIAMGIHKIPRETIQKGPHPTIVDVQAASFLKAHRVDKLVPVGWNVASFDMKFIEQVPLPLMMQYFSYRSVDLNAVCFHLSESYGIEYNQIKKLSKSYALEQLGETNWHDAGFDAAASLHSWNFLKKWTREQQAC